VSSARTPFADIGEAVIAAFAAAPIDSLCHAAFCDAVLVDTLVRRAPAIGTYQIERLPVAGSVGLSRLVETMDQSIPLLPARFRHLGVDGDTMSIGLAVVWSGGNVPATLTVLMPVELADSYGGMFFVSLERRNGRWHATRVVFEEG
jgi:hypothetical protein